MNKSNLTNAQWQQKSTYEKTVLFNESDFNAKGAKLQVVKIRSGNTVEPHYHNQRTEAFYVLQGKGDITLNGHTTTYSKGDYVLCPPKTVHALKNTSADEDFLIAVFMTNDSGEADSVWVDEDN